MHVLAVVARRDGVDGNIWARYGDTGEWVFVFHLLKGQSQAVLRININGGTSPSQLFSHSKRYKESTMAESTVVPPPLSQGTGYGVVVGLGAAFAIGTSYLAFYAHVFD